MSDIVVYGDGGFDPDVEDDNVADEFPVPAPPDDYFVDSGYRVATYFADTADTPPAPNGNGPEGHWYEIVEDDLGLALIVQRDEPFDPLVDVNADQMWIRVKPGIGVIGSTVEVAYVPLVTDGVENPDLLYLGTLLDPELMDAVLYPLAFELDDDDVPVAGSLILGEGFKLFATDEKWFQSSPARLRKIIEIFTDLDGFLTDGPIPVDIWTAEISGTYTGSLDVALPE